MTRLTSEERKLKKIQDKEPFTCPFCGRTFKKGKWITHNCVKKEIVRLEYNTKCEDNDFRVEYPTFQSYLDVTSTGKIPHSAYQSQVDSIPSPPDDYQNEPAKQNLDNSDYNRSIESEISNEFPDIDRTQLSETESIPVDSDITESQNPRSITNSISDTASRLAGKGIELKALGKMNKKLWAWRPIIQASHSLLMWLLKAKEREKYFDLSRDQANLLCNGYQNSFGDSPLYRIMKSKDNDDIDCLSAHIIVHGDIIITSAPILIDRGKEIYNKLKKYKEKKEMIKNEDKTEHK